MRKPTKPEQERAAARRDPRQHCLLRWLEETPEPTAPARRAITVVWAKRRRAERKAAREAARTAAREAARRAEQEAKLLAEWKAEWGEELDELWKADWQSGWQVDWEAHNAASAPVPAL
jgi:hypothetical protein